MRALHPFNGKKNISPQRSVIGTGNRRLAQSVTKACIAAIEPLESRTLFTAGVPGTLDSTFATGGQASLAIFNDTSGSGHAASAAVLSSGKIIVVGEKDNSF